MRVNKEEKGLNKEIEEMGERIRRVLEEEGREREGEKRRTGWWDEKCWRERRAIREKLRKAKKKSEDREVYKIRRREYREMCDRKKRNGMMNGQKG